MNMNFGDRGWVVRAISKLNAITRLHRLRRHVAALRVLENESARLVEQNQVLPSLKMKLKTRPPSDQAIEILATDPAIRMPPQSYPRGRPKPGNQFYLPDRFISVDSAKTAILKAV